MKTDEFRRLLGDIDDKFICSAGKALEKYVDSHDFEEKKQENNSSEIDDYMNFKYGKKG